MNVQAAIVRVHINDDDRVTSCVKCELANQRQRVKKLKCAPRESGSCGTFGNERQTRNASGRKLLGHGITSPGRGARTQCPYFVLRHRGRGGHRQPEAQRTKLSTSTKLSHSFVSPRSSSSIAIVRFRLRRPLALRHNTTHRDPPTPAPPSSGEAPQYRDQG